LDRNAGNIFILNLSKWFDEINTDLEKILKCKKITSVKELKLSQ